MGDISELIIKYIYMYVFTVWNMHSHKLSHLIRTWEVGITHILKTRKPKFREAAWFGGGHSKKETKSELQLKKPLRKQHAMWRKPTSKHVSVKAVNSTSTCKAFHKHRRTEFYQDVQGGFPLKGSTNVHRSSAFKGFCGDNHVLIQ